MDWDVEVSNVVEVSNTDSLTLTESLTTDTTSDLITDMDMTADIQSALFAQAQSYSAEVASIETDIGGNVTWYAAGGALDHLIFINQLKGAWPWLAVSGDAGVTFDDDGYALTMPDKGYLFSQILRRSEELDGIEPFTGEFRLYGVGTGEIQIQNKALGILQSKVWTSTLPTEVIDGVTYWYVDFNYSDASASDPLNLLITKMDESDHLHNMALVHHSHLDEYRAGEVFAPEFLKDLSSYSTLRFMDWMGVNLYTHDDTWAATDPAERYLSTTDFTFNTQASGWKQDNVYVSSAPIEYIVALANTLDTNAWINLPVEITDAQVAGIADYVAENLEDGLSVYWEYGNELWNSAKGFEDYFYAEAMAHATFTGMTATGLQAVAEWAAYRGPQVYDLIDVAFADHSELDVHYVAAGFAESPSLDHTETALDFNAYLVRYFQAAEAQKMADAGSRPTEIITDYAIGMYFGGTLDKGYQDAAVISAILAATSDADQQADLLGRYLMFGVAEDSLELDTSALSNPSLNVVYHEGLNIGVARLIWNDVQAGLDPLHALDQVLRLVGTELQYKGVNAATWTTILTFAATPDKTLAEMIADVELMGYGAKFQNMIVSGLRSGLEMTKYMRLDRHAAFVDGLGINFVAYEGGSHLFTPVAGAEAMYTAFSDGRAGAEVLGAWLQMMDDAGVDLYNHYMSHNRYATNDWWGVQNYVGEEAALDSSTQLLRDVAAIRDALEDTLVFDDVDAPVVTTPSTSVHLQGLDAILSGGTYVVGTDTTLVSQFNTQFWTGSSAWTLKDDSTATVGASNDPLTARIATTEGLRYTLSFTVDVRNATGIADMRVYAQALGGGANSLLSWEGKVSNGQTVTLDLAEIPEGRNALELTLRRYFNPQGEITIHDLNLVAHVPVPEVIQDGQMLTDPNAQAIDFAAESWTLGKGWTIQDATTIVQTTPSIDPITLVDRIDVAPGGQYEISFTVHTNSPVPTYMRVGAQAFKSGVTDVLYWEGQVTDGQTITLTLNEIPQNRDELSLWLRRAYGPQGSLSISDLTLTEIVPSPVDTVLG